MIGKVRSRLERLRSSGELHAAVTTAAKAATGAADFLFPGEEEIVETAEGPCYLREQRFPLTYHHGSTSLDCIMHCRGADLVPPARDNSLKDLQPCRSLFLDIETTGLSGGTGTWAFLIGLGWLENDEFCLRQYFLRHPAEEKAMLSHFTAAVKRFAGMITFNGRAFDLPLVQTRQVLAGLPLSTPRFHVDLLHCSRRLWKERLQSCSLHSLEQALLGLRRHDDIPGEEIPGVYFDYLRRGSTARLRDVFEHNVLDILSMVTLMARAARAAAEAEPEHPADSYSLGRIYAQTGQSARAEHYYRQAACCGDERLEGEAMLRLSFIYKRSGNWDEAVVLWNILIERKCHDLTPYIELAKYHEHRSGACNTALELTNKALSRTRARGSAPASGELSFPALQHRINRLEQKSEVGSQRSE